LRKLSLTHSDAAIRREAREFVRSIIDVAGDFGAPAIVGSIQGRWETNASREAALVFLEEALLDLGAHAAGHGVPLLFEPLNRYETNVFTQLGDVTAWLRRVRIQNVRLLADLFHMNIDEANSPAALREAGAFVGHVHFADSNRRAIGMGQTSIGPIVAALREIGYAGFLSAEVFALPDPMTAARQTITAFRQHVSLD
jgi:sugar phosphate isomerase/epimerase